MRASFGRLRRCQRVALALFANLIALLIGGVLYGAYGYQPRKRDVTARRTCR
jgi:hypothetical protein